MKIGFLGTGIMGGPMAGHLVDNGHDIYVDGSHTVPDSLREQVYLCNSANAGQLQISLPNTATAQQLFNAVAAMGESELDHSAMILALEKLAEHNIGD
jgi:3-hydroxyisobutyrate dehydrogenase-like beta-hydroxyacid dehydrogenase